MPRIRLYVDQPLGKTQAVPLSREQAHYLFAVMRLSVGAEVVVFNGVDGEWQAHVAQAGKRGGVLVCDALLRAQSAPPDLWLMFAPLKKTRTMFVVEKAVEMGARRIVPVQTEFTNADRIRQDRLQANAIEAAEQCGALSVPQVAELTRLPVVMDKWADRNILFCDEAPDAPSQRLQDLPAGPWAVLIGPEGGFSETERKRLRARDDTYALSLGPRILRAETAVVAALTLWQSALGDWQ